MKQHPQAAGAPILEIVKMRPWKNVKTITSAEEAARTLGGHPRQWQEFFEPVKLYALSVAPAAKYPHAQGEPIRLTDEQIAEWRAGR